MLALAGWVNTWYVWTSIAACLIASLTFGLRHTGKISAWVVRRVGTVATEPIHDEVDDIVARMDKFESLLYSVHYQLHKNSGHSMYDDVQWIKQQTAGLVTKQADISVVVNELKDDVDELKTEVAEHRGFHQGLTSHP